MRIVVVEDNEMLLSGIDKTFRDAGHSVESFSDGHLANQHLQHEGADLAIIDINLPGVDGLDITRQLRARQQDFPVLMLTARSSTEDRVAGLDAGADDYLVKPFAMAELEARVRALGRRRGAFQSDREIIGCLCYQRNSRRLFHDDKELELARREKMLFEALLEKQDQFVSKSLLADTLYGVGSDTDLNAVELAISRLRKALQGCGVSIRTARGIGYMLEAESE